MSDPQKPTQYQTLLRKHSPQQRAPKSVEEQLDALLEVGKRRPSGEDPGSASDVRTSALDDLRSLLRDELLAVFQDIRAKYAPAGILMEIDAEGFLAGGATLTIEVQFESCGMRMEGTATSGGLAFQETRFSNKVPGVVTTGPMLSARKLSAEAFREFLCERVGQLVRSAVRRREGSHA